MQTLLDNEKWCSPEQDWENAIMTLVICCRQHLNLSKIGECPLNSSTNRGHAFSCYILRFQILYKQLKNGRVSQQWRIYLFSLVIIQWKRYCIIHLSLTTRIFFSVLDKIFIEKGCSFTNSFVTNIRTFLGKYYRIPVNKALPHISPHNRKKEFKK